MDAVEDAAFGYFQIIQPLRLLLTSELVALLGTILAKARGGALLTAATTAASLIVLSPVLYVAAGFLQPSRQNEAAEDPDLREVLRLIPRDGALLISSDLADPGSENAGSARRGFLLTAYEGHQFYVANIEYHNYLNSDAGDRMANLQAFFGSPLERLA